MYFQTEQIKLRPFEMEDAADLRAYLNHPKLSGRRYLPHGFPEEVPLSLIQAEAIIKRWAEKENEAHLAIELSDRGELIGHTEFEWNWDPQAPWVSIVIARPQQRQGYGIQVMRLILEYLFESTPAHNISSWMADWNKAARSFAKKLGFQESGRSRREGFRSGRYFDGILVDILRPEYLVKGGSNYATGR
ncbi:MAG: GNAT family N-acetyltransferase [Chloroflexota bacterium]|nr:MAG: GNAT family N-acetyltransferase [Chloroflexota bacterium]